MESIGWARKVLGIEGRAVLKASETIGETFGLAVEEILRCKGKLIFCGMGKSGQVAQKIASTCSSTGTPSVFLHPADALHGDLGVMQQGDILVAIAYGGETAEVLQVVQYARRISNKIIAITGSCSSSLAGISDFVVDSSVDQEADSLGLAPTASSTVALALGDAIAVALMRARSFSQVDFAKMHPAGSLGKRFLKVQEIMRPIKEFSVLHPLSNFHDILQAITTPNFGIAAIVGEDRTLIGSITDGDLRRALLIGGARVLDQPAKLLMTETPKTIGSDEFVLDGLNLMDEFKITALFVTDHQKKAVGLLRMHDLMSAKVV